LVKFQFHFLLFSMHEEERTKRHSLRRDFAPPSSSCARMEIIETAAVTAICPDDIGRVLATHGPSPFPASLCLQAQVFVDASAVPVAELAPARAGRSENKTAATGIAGCDGTPHSTPDGRRSTKKIW
jgi:hypothetical protein